MTALRPGWAVHWEATCAQRWTITSDRECGYPLYVPRATAAAVTLPPESQAAILDLERFINDGRQLSLLPGKEET